MSDQMPQPLSRRERRKLMAHTEEENNETLDQAQIRLLQQYLNMKDKRIVKLEEQVRVLEDKLIESQRQSKSEPLSASQINLQD